MSTIYIIKNTVNDKIYIGQTKHCFRRRFKRHLAQTGCKTNCTALTAAFLKYGKDKFYVEEIISGDFDKEKLNMLETFCIEQYDSLAPKGYNLQTGGNSFNMSKESIEKISAAMTGREIKWKDKVSAGLVRLWENPEYRAKMVEKHTGKRGYKYKKHTKPLRLDLDISMIKSMRAEGHNIPQIAKHFGVVYQTIKCRL